MNQTDNEVATKHDKQTYITREMEPCKQTIMTRGSKIEVIVTKKEGAIVTDMKSLNGRWIDFRTNQGLKKTKNK